MERKASAQWNGGLKDGKGAVSTASGALKGIPYSFAMRFGDTPGTNPEELVAAAHAGCFSMALSGELEKVGYRPDRIETKATLNFDKTDAGWAVKSIHLDVTAKVPGADPGKCQTRPRLRIGLRLVIGPLTARVPLSGRRTGLQGPGGGHDVLLVDGRGHELEPEPPRDRLPLVRVGPDCVEHVIGSDRKVRVVADEPATEMVSRVDRVRRHCLRGPGDHIGHDVVQSRVVDVRTEGETVDPSNGHRRRGRRAGLPRRDDVSGIGGHEHLAGRRRGHGGPEAVDATRRRSVQGASIRLRDRIAFRDAIRGI